MSLDAKKNPTFLASEQQFFGKYAASVYYSLAKTFQPLRGRLIFSLFVGITARAVLLFNANIVGFWADSLCQGSVYCKNIPHTFANFSSRDFLVLLFCTVCLGFLLNCFFRVTITRYGAQSISLLYDEVTFKINRMPMSFFDVTPVGRIISRFSSDYGALFRMAGGPLGEIFSLFFDLLLILILICIASPHYAPLIVITLILNFFVYKANISRLRKERRDLSLQRSPSIAHFSETCQGYRTVRTYGKVAEFTRRFVNLADLYLAQKLRASRQGQFFAVQMNALTALLLLVTGLTGLYLVKSGAASLGSIAVAFTFVTMASSNVQQFFESLANLEEALTGAERLDNYLRLPLELGSSFPQQQSIFSSTTSIESVSEMKDVHHPTAVSVCIKNLSLRYRNDLPLVLNNISFEMFPGEKMGIVGRTGSGKSTLVQALFQLYPAEKGSILIDGQTPFPKSEDELQISLDEYRGLISYIPQESILFRGTLRENIDLPKLWSESEILDAIHAAGLSAWLDTLGNRPLDFLIEERGANISKGQKQLVSLVRCLLRQSPLVVLDEATSSIDPHSEALITESLSHFMRNRTQIIIAHRLSTLESCHSILWMEHGQVVMKGPSDKVLSAFKK